MERQKKGPRIRRVARNIRSDQGQNSSAEDVSPVDRFTLAVELWDEILAHPKTFEVTEEQLLN